MSTWHLPHMVQDHTSYRGPTRAFDGRLTADEIKRSWHINADLVTLSASSPGLLGWVCADW